MPRSRPSLAILPPEVLAPTACAAHSVIVLILWLAFSPALVEAQIVRDNSLGSMKNQPLVGPNYAIIPELGAIEGSNLFHSFNQFNVNTLPGGTVESATFTGPPTIGNILTRVSGTTFSNINGLIRSDIQGANLFLFNPNGVVFGPNASLNVSGAVAFSTANYIRFVDGAKFFASLSQSSTLTTTPIAAFGFFGPVPAPITFQDGTVLEMAEGRALSVIGGNISMTGALFVVPSGQVNLASAASAGEVVFSAVPGAPPIEMQGFTAQGQISITQGSGVDVSGGSGPGHATIRAGRVLVTNQSFVSSDNLAGEDAVGLGVDIHAPERVSVTNGAAVTAAVGGTGQSGGVTIKTATLEVSNGASIVTSSFAPGNAGLLTVEATKNVMIDRVSAPGASTGLFTDSFDSGQGGLLIVRTPELTIAGGRIRSLALGTGDAGTVMLEAEHVTVMGAGRVDAGAVGGSSGQPGTVTVVAPQAVIITGSGSGLFSDTSGQGGGGVVHVMTPSLSVDQGRISAFTAGLADAGRIELEIGTLDLTRGGQVIADAVASSSGRAGSLTITATQKASMTGQDAGGNFSGLFASTAGKGGGGQIAVDAPVVEVNGGRIQAVTTATGAAGEVQMNVRQLTVFSGGQISTGAGSGSVGPAGQLTVMAADSLLIDGATSGLFADTSGSGAAGSIHVIAPMLEVEGGAIQARRDGPGGGGSIHLNSHTIALQGGGRIDTGTSIGKAGDAGSINITAADRITIAGLGVASNPSGIFGDAESNSLGQGSRILVTAGMLEMQGGRIQATTRGAGTGGPVTVDVRQLMLLSGAEIASSTGGPAAGGPVTVTASEQILVSGFRTDSSGTVFRSSISSDVLPGSSGAGGRLVISAPLIRLFDNGEIEAATAGTGPGGEIAIDAGQLDVSGGAQISVGTRGMGTAGKLTVNATQLVSISGGSTLGNSGLFAPATAGSQGNAGTIVLATPNLTVVDGGLIEARTSGAGRGGSLQLTASQALFLGTGGEISTRTFGPGPGGTVNVTAGSAAFTGAASGLFTTASGLGAGGDINLKAGAVQLSDGALISAAGSGSGNAGKVFVAADTAFQNTNSTVSTAAAQGSGGDVTITAGQSLILTDGTISAQSTGPGNAGDIILAAGNTIAMAGSKVVTEATIASGGNITLQAPYLIQLTNSTVSSSVAGGVQTIGGNIVIDPQFLILQNSQIIAQALAGQGGNILINAGVFIADPSSLVSASSQLGVSGTVTVNSPIQNLSATLAPLTQRYLAAARFLRERCVVRARSSLLSSLLVRGRDGLPREPGGLMPSPPFVLPPVNRGGSLPALEKRPALPGGCGP